MASHQPAEAAVARMRWTILAALVFVSAALMGVVLGQSSSPWLAWSSAEAFATDRPRGDYHHPARRGRGQDRQHGTRTAATSIRPATRGEAAGAVRRGLTVFDEDSPAVANLDPDLLRALRQAARDAASHGVEIVVNSGWRSPAYQERLLRQAVSKYGSEEKAARWVATADTSSHVSGDAVDIGPSRATAWLSRHGAEYRLCQIYTNEPWHFELRRDAIADGCPSMYADPRHDPRMHQ